MKADCKHNFYLRGRFLDSRAASLSAQVVPMLGCGGVAVGLAPPPLGWLPPACGDDDADFWLVACSIGSYVPAYAWLTKLANSLCIPYCP